VRRFNSKTLNKKVTVKHTLQICHHRDVVAIMPVFSSKPIGIRAVLTGTVLLYMLIIYYIVLLLVGCHDDDVKNIITTAAATRPTFCILYFALDAFSACVINRDIIITIIIFICLFICLFLYPQ